jgi:hypothetical protein
MLYVYEKVILNSWTLIKFLVLCVALLLLSGCSLPSKFEIYNNTGKELYVIQDGYGQRKSFNLTLNSSLTITSWDISGESHFTVIIGEKRWHYKPSYISHGYGDLNYFSHWLFKIQIENDGSVFVLEPGKDFPQTKHVHQPEGYPLMPDV